MGLGFRVFPGRIIYGASPKCWEMLRSADPEVVSKVEAEVKESVWV